MDFYRAMPSAFGLVTSALCQTGFEFFFFFFIFRLVFKNNFPHIQHHRGRQCEMEFKP